ncbi:mannose-1-phosphate guanylyltransferase [Candidatus Marinamargulisbacteria bacterium SCGC AAA071-K20]|nr:mannose-1-phosphate guanylyltransferase [Candidatus Marinamargulisbacteria bacterium SCGC AAA071-K20]
MIYTVVMAGGKGTRFWPLSRAVRAKQFLKLIGNHTLIESTIKRMESFCKRDNIFVVSNERQKKHLNDLDSLMPKKNILKEPIGKNTLPCIGWAASEILKKDKDAIMVILPSDHHIKPKGEFIKTIKKAIQEVKKNNTLVTIGIKPSHAHTGYGYIETENNKESVSKVVAFKEKPSKKMAEKYIKNGNFYWNAGIFIWRADLILELIEKHHPKNAKLLKKLGKLKKTDKKGIEKCFNAFESISIDYGILEKESSRIRLVKSSFEWNDIGNWSALEGYLNQDKKKNSYKSNLIQINSKGNIAFSEKKLIACVDVENLVIVETEDAILVLPKESDQKIKDLYELLPSKYK